MLLRFEVEVVFFESVVFIGKAVNEEDSRCFVLPVGAGFNIFFEAFELSGFAFCALWLTNVCGHKFQQRVFLE